MKNTSVISGNFGNYHPNPICDIMVNRGKGSIMVRVLPGVPASGGGGISEICPILHPA